MIRQPEQARVEIEHRSSYVRLVFPWPERHGSISIPLKDELSEHFDGFYERLVACWNRCEGMTIEEIKHARSR